MKKNLRLLALLLAVMMLSTVVVGCGGDKSATETSTANTSVDTAASTDAAKDSNAIDTSKEGELNFVLLGDQPKDMQSVTDEVNKLAKKDLNVSVNWTFLGWDKWNDKYNLKLSSGEKIDLIYTANWADYSVYARKGAYLPLDEDAPKYAPLSWKNMAEDKWQAAKVGGKIYTVPCDWQELKSNGILYRADLAEKFGITNPITTWEDMEKYFDACLKEFPNVVPFNETSDKIKDATITAGLMKYETPVSESVYYAVTENNDSTKLLNYFETPEFEAYANRMKSWYDKGYWSKTVLSNKTEGLNLFNEGKTFACKSNIAGVEGAGKDWLTQHPEWKVNIFLNSDVKGVIHSNAAIGNGIALPRACSDIPRSLAFLDKLRYDKNYYMLTQYGILDKHYTLDGEGKLTPKGSTEQTGFGVSAMQPWGWHVDSMEPGVPQEWAGKPELHERMEKILTPRKTDAFAFDIKPVAAQFAALEQVRNQYIMPVMVGISKDVKADIVKIDEKLKSAGVDAYNEEVKKQLDTYWKEMGY